jgi:PhoPQ-activated pathogenicity-related protein
MHTAFSGPISLKRALLFSLVFLACSFHFNQLQAQGLEKYVHREDSHFKWNLKDQSDFQNARVFQMELTSQKWREHVWHHNLVAVRPATMRHPEIAFLYITGNTSGHKTVPMLKILADRAGAMAAVLTHVPNQPLYDGRSEDALIAYTFEKYLKTGDETWPALLPMVKSAVRAMDALEAFATAEHKESIKQFVVAGASKRGWTTWLTAASDPRVAAIAPMVIDMLNMKEQLQWADKVYGKQSEQIHDYTELQLHMKMDYPEMIQLRAMVDPYSYRKRYTMPKLLLLGTNDPYWTVDSLRHYWEDLPGPKLIFQTPNAGHDLGGGEQATQTLAAFFQMIADHSPLPKISWKFKPKKNDNVNIQLKVNQQAQSIKLWQSTSNDRDFRDDKWTSQDLEIIPGSSQAKTNLPAPSSGFRAYLGEITLTSPTGHPYKLSTEARVTPDNIK